MTSTEDPPSPAQCRHLRGLAHTRKPVVRVAQKGLNDKVLAEIDQALLAHELIKVSIRVGDRSLRDRLVADICGQSGATLVQRIGNVATFYRRHPQRPVIALPTT